MQSVWPLFSGGYIPGLHMTQGVFMKLFRLLEDTCHQFDLQLAYTYQEESSSSSSSFTKYAEELHKLQVAKAKLPEAQDSLAALEEAVMYVVVAYGEDSPITDILIRHALDRRQSVEKMLRPPKEFALHDGPFVKGLDEALQSFKVQWQQYFGGVFVDASDLAVGAVLQQHINNSWETLAFFSKKLKCSETKYSAFDWELLALYLGVNHFRHFLEGIDYSAMAASQIVDQEVQSYRTALSGLVLQDIPFGEQGDTLLYDTSTGHARPVVPVSWRRQVFDLMHSLSHPSIRTTRKLISSKFVWNGLRKIGWPEAIPLNDRTTVVCAQALISQWFARFGIPADMTSDRGTSQLCNSIAQLLGIQVHHTTAYHPQANGPNWTADLPWVLLGIRTAPKDDLGCSSAELVYELTLTLNYNNFGIVYAHTFQFPPPDIVLVQCYSTVQSSTEGSWSLNMSQEVITLTWRVHTTSLPVLEVYIAPPNMQMPQRMLQAVVTSSAASPTLLLASAKIAGVRGDVTVKSKAAGLPCAQSLTSTSAGRVRAIQSWSEATSSF
eukprot:Em0017g962a